MTCDKIGHNEYEHVLKVWNTFQIKTMRDYHDLCSKCDALLLTDVFEKFTNSRLKNQKIKDYVQVVIWMHQL